MPHSGHSRAPAAVPGSGSDHARKGSQFLKIGDSLEEVAAIVRQCGLTVVSVVGAPPGFEGHWRVMGGGGHILCFSRRPGNVHIYLSEHYRNAWEEIKDRRP